VADGYHRHKPASELYESLTVTQYHFGRTAAPLTRSKLAAPDPRERFNWVTRERGFFIWVHFNPHMKLRSST